MKSLLAPKSLFDQAIALINAGDLAAAEERCSGAAPRRTGHSSAASRCLPKSA